MNTIKSFVLVTLILLFSVTMLFSADGPTEIADKAALKALMQDQTKWADDFILTDDIDMTGETVTPIGIMTIRTEEESGSYDWAATTSDTPFSGTFDGAGHKITGLSFELADVVTATLAETDSLMVAWGLFGHTDGATIKNLVLEIALALHASDFEDTDASARFVGGLIGYAIDTEVNNVQVNTTFVGDDSLNNTEFVIGGLAGKITQTGSTFTNAIVKVNVTDADFSGIVGEIGTDAGATKSTLNNIYVTFATGSDDPLFTLAKSAKANILAEVYTFEIAGVKPFTAAAGADSTDHIVADLVALQAKVVDPAWAKADWAVDKHTANKVFAGFNDGYPFLRNANEGLADYVIPFDMDDRFPITGAWTRLFGDDTRVMGLPGIITFEGAKGGTLPDSIKTYDFFFTEYKVIEGEDTLNVVAVFDVFEDVVLVSGLDIQETKRIDTTVKDTEKYDAIADEFAGGALWAVDQKKEDNAGIVPASAFGFDDTKIALTIAAPDSTVEHLYTPTFHIGEGQTNFTIEFRQAITLPNADSIQVDFVVVDKNGTGTAKSLLDKPLTFGPNKVLAKGDSLFNATFDETVLSDVKFGFIVSTLKAGSVAETDFEIAIDSLMFNWKAETYENVPENIADLNPWHFFAGNVATVVFDALADSLKFGNIGGKLQVVAGTDTVDVINNIASFPVASTNVIDLKLQGLFTNKHIVASAGKYSIQMIKNVLVAGDTTSVDKRVSFSQDFKVSADSLNKLGWTGYDFKEIKKAVEVTEILPSTFTIGTMDSVKVDTTAVGTQPALVLPLIQTQAAKADSTEFEHWFFTPSFTIPRVVEGAIDFTFDLQAAFSDSLKNGAFVLEFTARKVGSDPTVLGLWASHPAKVTGSEQLPDSTRAFKVDATKVKSLEGGDVFFAFRAFAQVDKDTLLVNNDVTAKIMIGNFSISMANDGFEIDIPTVPGNRLVGNYPNPFNPTTTIRFDLKKESRVSIDVYNIKGQKVKTVANDTFGPGMNSVVWNGQDNNGRNVGSGVYFYRMSTDGYTATKKMILIK